MIGENIKKIRKEKKLKQEELGELLGVSAAMVSQWERGERNPKPETIQKIAKSLDKTVNELMWDIKSFEYLDTLRKAGANSIETLAKMMNITYDRCLALLTETETPSAQEQEKLQLIAGLNFEELLAPVERDNVIPDNVDDLPLQNTLKESLNVAFEKLNAQGQEKAVENVELLTKVPEYKK